MDPGHKARDDNIGVCGTRHHSSRSTFGTTARWKPLYAGAGLWLDPGDEPRDDKVAHSLETLTSLLVMNSSSAGCPFSVAAMPRLMAATMSPGFSTRSP